MITDLISKINQRVGAKVQYAQVTRWLWSLLQEAEDVFDRVHAPTLKRPSTGAEHEYAAFEADLAAYLLDLLQAVKPQPR